MWSRTITNGHLIDPDFDPAKEPIYTGFAEYFNNPPMTKIKDVEQYTMYAAKIEAFLGVENRYVVAFVRKDQKENGTAVRLRDLEWTSLQTRTLADEHAIPMHSYFPRRHPGIDKRIVLDKNDEKRYDYRVEDLPLQVTLLVSGKHSAYYKEGSVTSALETYQAIVTWLSPLTSLKK